MDVYKIDSCSSATATDVLLTKLAVSVVLFFPMLHLEVLASLLASCVDVSQEGEPESHDGRLRCRNRPSPQSLPLHPPPSQPRLLLCDTRCDFARKLSRFIAFAMSVSIQRLLRERLGVCSSLVEGGDSAAGVCDMMAPSFALPGMPPMGRACDSERVEGMRSSCIFMNM